jgi:hypothetical protein
MKTKVYEKQADLQLRLRELDQSSGRRQLLAEEGGLEVGLKNTAVDEQKCHN